MPRQGYGLSARWLCSRAARRRRPPSKARSNSNRSLERPGNDAISVFGFSKPFAGAAAVRRRGLVASGAARRRFCGCDWRGADPRLGGVATGTAKGGLQPVRHLGEILVRARRRQGRGGGAAARFRRAHGGRRPGRRFARARPAGRGMDRLVARCHARRRRLAAQFGARLRTAAERLRRESRPSDRARGARPAAPGGGSSTKAGRVGRGGRRWLGMSGST